MALLRSKLTLVVLCAVLVGGAAAILGAMSAAQPSASSAQLAANSSNGGSSGTGSSPTATGRGTPTAGPRATPTNTPLPPTPRPTPTSTPIPIIGQTYTFRGDIGSINPSAQTFVLNVRGGSYIIQVMQSTQWPGYAKSISGTQPVLASGMQGDVTGVYQGGGNLTASSVDAQIDH